VYSPFTTREGVPIFIHNLQHRHLEQLSTKEVQEGYQVEFKSELSDTVKKKIPKIITSFANSEGGWLFIGVDEKTGDIDKLQKPPRTDFSQIIAQLLREHASPLPAFEARFLKAPQSNYGVLAVYVYEGNDPPYITDGTVYIRNGSSSEPQRSQRADIDHLYQKAKDFDAWVDRFCKRKIYYPMDTLKTGQIVVCNTYILNANHIQSTLSAKDWIEWADRFISLKSNQFDSYMYSGNSIVFRNSKVLGTAQISVLFELFFDYSVKIHMPLQRYDVSHENAVNKLIRATGQQHIDEFMFLDGYIACKVFQYLIQQYFDFLRSEGIDYTGFVYRMELENAHDSLLYFDSDAYIRYVQKHGIPFCCKEQMMLPPSTFSLKEDNGLDFVALLPNFFFSFGFEPVEGAAIYTDSMRSDPDYFRPRNNS